MTKRWMKCSAVLFAFTMLFAGCSGEDKGSSDDLLGRWTWSKLVINGMTLNLADPLNPTPGGSTTITPAFLAQLGVNASLTVTFKADETLTGTLSATIPGQPPINESGSGTWSVSGDDLTVRFTLEGENIVLKGTYDVSGSLLSVAMSNAQLLELLGTNDVDLSQLSPSQQNLLRGLSGSVEFVR